MQRLILATIACCAAWPCAASVYEPTPHWAWQPIEVAASDSASPITSLPQVLVSATQYDAGLTDALRHDPVPAIADQLDDSDLDLFPEATIALPVAPEDIPLPRPRVVLKLPNVPIEQVCDTLLAAAQAQRLPPTFFTRLIWQESRFDPRAISPVGAQGMAQFMPETAAAMGLKNPFDPLEALRASARLLSDLLGQFGNLGLAAAAYNAGPKRIVDWLAKRSKLPEETRHYVQSITGHAAERWRSTRPGRFKAEVPKRVPCQDITDVAYVVEVPAPIPVPKHRARAHLLAKHKTGDHKPGTAGHKTATADISAARKRHKSYTAAKPKPLIERASAARKHAKERRIQTAGR